MTRGGRSKLAVASPYSKSPRIPQSAFRTPQSAILRCYTFQHMAETRTLITAEQLPEVAGDRRVELVRGELVEMASVGVEQFGVAGVLIGWLREW